MTQSNTQGRTSAYYADALPPAPPCGPADYATALSYLHQIEKTLTIGGWTDFEMMRLRKLRKLWARRAFGKDPRFNAVGTQQGKGGRLPADVEHALKPKIARARAEERAASRQPQDQRWNRYHDPSRIRGVNADLPSGRAKGHGADQDPDFHAFEPEPGDVALPVIPPARQYIIPGQDTKGHAQRVWCRVMPAHYRALCAIERSKAFGFRTVGDVIRWCIDYGVRELSERAKVPHTISALAQVDAIREVLLDEQYYLEFPQLFEQMTTTINRHLSAGAEGEAVRLIGIVRHQIEQMGEEYWRDKYMTEFMRHYGTYLDGTRNKGLAFGD